MPWSAANTIIAGRRNTGCAVRWISPICRASDSSRPSAPSGLVLSSIAACSVGRSVSSSGAIAGNVNFDAGFGPVFMAYISMPRWALMPCWNACLTGVISVTVSAASISACGAPRPVITTCCIGGRARRSAITVSTSR